MPARKVKVWEEPTTFARFITFITFGTLGEQDADAVAITGGTIAGTTQSVAAGLTAAGTNQATALVLVKNDVTEISTTAASTGVVLPTAVAGDRMFIYNGGASTLNVFPAVGAAIDAEATDAARTMATDVGFSFYAVTATLWVTNKA